MTVEIAGVEKKRLYQWRVSTGAASFQDSTRTGDGPVWIREWTRPFLKVKRHCPSVQLRGPPPLPVQWRFTVCAGIWKQDNWSVPHVRRIFPVRRMFHYITTLRYDLDIMFMWHSSMAIYNACTSCESHSQ